MGCCQSIDNGAPGDEQLDGAAGGQGVAPGHGHAGPHGSVARGPNHANAPSQPIQLPPPISTSPDDLPQYPPPWTRSLLERKRAEFFDTQVSGDPQAWAAIRRVCELLREGTRDEAQTVCDAAGLSTPFGQVTRAKNSDGRRGVVYDSIGRNYKTPAWAATDPLDIIEDGGADGEKHELDSTAGAAEDDYTDDDDPKHDVQAPPREEKGKGRAVSPGKKMRVILRRSDEPVDVPVTYHDKETVATLINNFRNLIGGRRVRLIFHGKQLDETKTLIEQGFKDGHVINAFVDQPSED